jgi:hypothetical protein
MNTWYGMLLTVLGAGVVGGSWAAFLEFLRQRRERK